MLGFLSLFFCDLRVRRCVLVTNLKGVYNNSGDRESHLGFKLRKIRVFSKGKK